MSATIDKNKFSEYFDHCPVIEVPGQTFPVKIYYEPIQKDYVNHSINKAKQLINENLIDGDVIIFLPAIDEINKAVKEFSKYISSRKLDEKYLVFALHGRLEPEEQVKVFETYPNKYKIIFSSNVAETSVTINSARIIIDSGRTKERTYDQSRNISVFKIKLITQSSAIQRKGRAGRCSPGVCYRLYSNVDYEDMQPILEPEIFRMHLGIVVLQLLSCGIENIFNYDLIDTPSHETFRSCMQKLESLQMIENGKINDNGLIASELYLEPSIARIIIEGLKLGVGDETIKIAAMMTISNILYSRSLSFDDKDLCKLASSQVEGDFISLIKIYNQFDSFKNRQAKLQWCNEKQYSFSSLNSAKQAYNELHSALTKMKNNELANSINNLQKTELDKNKVNVILKCICAGLHSNLAYFNGKVNGKSVYKLVENDQEAFISYESVLSVLGDEDYENKFLLFGDLFRNDRLFMRNLTPVSLEMFKLYTDKDYSKLTKMVKVCVRKQVNDKILNFFKNKSEELIEKLEEELFHTISVNNKTIETHVPKNLEAFALNIIDKYINDIKQRALNELYEYIPDEENTNYKLLFKASLKVQAVLLSDQFLRINFYDLPPTIDKDALSSIFMRFGNVLEMKLIKNQMNKINGFVLYDDCDDASRAYDNLNGNLFEEMF